MSYQEKDFDALIFEFVLKSIPLINLILRKFLVRLQNTHAKVFQGSML
jgi:hypothetical protein